MDVVSEFKKHVINAEDVSSTSKRQLPHENHEIDSSLSRKRFAANHYCFVSL